MAQYLTKRLKQKTGDTRDTPAAGEDNVTINSDAQTRSVAEKVEEEKRLKPKGVNTGDAGIDVDLEASKDNHGRDPTSGCKETTRREDYDAAGVSNVHDSWHLGHMQSSAEDDGPNVPTEEKTQTQPKIAGEQDSTQPAGVNSTPEELVMDITREEFIEAQKQDPASQHIWQQARAQSQEPERKQIENGILLRQWRQLSGEKEEEKDLDEGEGHTTIVVPTKYRTQVLKRGHDCAGHHGVKKTKKLVEDHLFWSEYNRLLQEVPTVSEG